MYVVTLGFRIRRDRAEAFLHEVYGDEAAFQDHLETARFGELDASSADRVESKQTATWHRVSGVSP